MLTSFHIENFVAKKESEILSIFLLYVLTQANEKYKGDSVLQKTYKEDYLNIIRRKNVGQHPKYYVTGSHPAIILPELFDKVQEEMFRRARLVTDEKGNSLNSGKRYSSKYLLSNLLACGNCGAGFRRRTERGKIDVYEKQVIICLAKVDKYEACELD